MSVEELTEPIETVQYRRGVVSTVADLRSELRKRSWTVQSWTDSPGTVHSAHDHPYSHRVLCRSGWIEFTTNGNTHRLQPGDALDLPAGVTHKATSNPSESTEYWLLRKKG